MSSSQRGAEILECEDFSLPYEKSLPENGGCVELDAPQQSHLQELASTIEASIIPRLLVNHGVPDARMSRELVSGLFIQDGDVDCFMRLTMGEDNSEASDFVFSLLIRGFTLDVIMLDLFAPAARRMGEMWTADLCTFVDVTLGLSRMHQMLRRLSNSTDGSVCSASERGSALLVPAPGEQHTFGLRVLEEFLIRDGWDVRSNLRASNSDVIQLVQDNSYDFVGFTLSGETLIDVLASAIKQVRKVSQNRSIRVIVGGVMFVGRRDLVSQVGADGTAIDARDAVRQVNQWARASLLN